MMRKRRIVPVLALAAGTLFLAAGLVWAAVATARHSSEGGKNVGEVLLENKVVMQFQVGAGGYSARERAEAAVERLNSALQKSSDWKQFSVKPTSGLQGLYGGDQLISTVTGADADAAGTSVRSLAEEWRDNVILALGGDPPRGEVDPRYGDWEGVKNKWVPILDVANNGVRLGAAQVAGPEVQVDQCKAVAQLELSFKNLARIKAYVPIDSYNVIRLHRVQGVSVWATGDIRIVKF